MKKDPKWKRDMDRWIEETQMFQRIAKVPESSYDDLAQEWKKSRSKSPDLVESIGPLSSAIRNFRS